MIFEAPDQLFELDIFLIKFLNDRLVYLARTDLSLLLSGQCTAILLIPLANRM